MSSMFVCTVYDLLYFFQLTEAKFFNVHWDGKMLSDLQGESNSKVDRLPVIVTFDGNEQLLGVPKVSSGEGKGKRIAEAVHGLLIEWGIADRVQALSFDTTSTNTGPFRGASLLLEQLLERDLLYLPCRHHIYELELKEAFEDKFGKTSSPGVPMFARFKEKWANIKDKPYSSGIEDDEVAIKIPVHVQIEIKTFCLTQLNDKHPRADYKEFLEIVLLFLGEDIPNYHFIPPGPISHARWMAKGIYCPKMFLFRKHLRLTKKELNGLRDISIFIVTLYVKAWFGCTRAIAAPNQDLEFLKAATEYASIDQKLSQKLVAKFCGHLWYLSGEAVALALFDENVPDETKVKMTKAMQVFENEGFDDELPGEESEDEEDEGGDERGNEETDEYEDSSGGEADDEPAAAPPAPVVGFERVKRIKLRSKQVNQDFIAKDLSHFVTSETQNLLKRFGLQSDFIYTEPKTWPGRDDYRHAQEIIRKLHVVNDAAERGVKLVEDYNNVLCRNEKEKQFLLQVVSRNRKLQPSHDKNKLI